MNKVIRFIVLLFVTFIVMSSIASYSVHAQSYLNWNSTNSLTQTTTSATSVVYNGYVYEIGGYKGSTFLSTVEYAPLNNNGTIGSWIQTTSLPTATAHATSVVYNGYVYEIGGCPTTCPTATVDYAPINSNGTLGSWTQTTSLPTATDAATSVIYNGYVYEIEGYTGFAYLSTVDYAPINSNGTLGSWTQTTSLPTATYGSTSVVYNGYVYEIGGCATTCPLTTVDYAPINSNGTLGSWNSTTSLLTATQSATSVVYNGYIYEIGGCSCTTATTTVDYALINSNGTLGTWTQTTSLPTATQSATSVVYNGYIYEIGGYNNNSSLNTVYYANVDLGRLQGYTIAGSDGNLFYFGTTNYGDMSNVPPGVPTKQIVGFAQTPGDLGYYILTKDGGVYTFGNAQFFGSLYNIPASAIPNRVPVAFGITPPGNGYYIVTQDGAVYTFGNAQFQGSIYNIPASAIPNRVPVALGITPSNNGYYIVTQDGAVYTFGTAQFQGSIYNIPNAPVKTTVAFSLTPNGNGYYLITQNGAVYTFGTAQFQGSMYNISNPPVRTPVAFQLTSNGKGYYIITQDGGVYTFGNAMFLGSITGLNVTPVTVQ